MSWFQIWTVCWQVAIFLTPIVVGGCVLWMRSQFVTKADAVVERNRVDGAIANLRQEARGESNRVDGQFKQEEAVRSARWDLVRDKLADHEGRLAATEKDIAKPPSRHDLKNMISVMQGGMHAVEKSLEELGRRMEAQGSDQRRGMETMNSYLHTMIEKHLA